MDRFDFILKTELENRGYTADIVQLRDEMINRSGLFIVIGEGIEFRHLMMQEFFAGRGISSTDFLNTIVTDPWVEAGVSLLFRKQSGRFCGTLLGNYRTQRTNR